MGAGVPLEVMEVAPEGLLFAAPQLLFPARAPLHINHAGCSGVAEMLNVAAKQLAFTVHNVRPRRTVRLNYYSRGPSLVTRIWCHPDFVSRPQVWVWTSRSLVVLELLGVFS